MSSQAAPQNESDQPRGSAQPAPQAQPDAVQQARSTPPTQAARELMLDASHANDLDRAMMQRAIALAQKAGEQGEVPVAAVVYRGQTVLGQGHNRREVEADPTAHAEIVAMRQACRKLGTWRLDDCAMAVTLEPCPMCAGAMVNARLGRVVYGCDDPKMGCVRTLYALLHDPRFNHRVQAIAGVQADACATLLREFFAARRGKDRPDKPRPPRQ